MKPSKPPSKFARFSLRAAFCALTIALIVFGAYARRAHLQANAVRTIVAHGGHVIYDVQEDESLDSPISQAIGIDFIYSVIEVDLWSDRVTDTTAVMTELVHCSRVKVLYLRGEQASDEWIGQVASLPCLERLSVSEAHYLSEQGLSRLSQASKMRELHLSDITLADSSAADIARMHNLESLSFYSHTYSDEAVRQFASLENLRELCLNAGPYISNKSIEYIAEIESLEVLDLQSTAVTLRGLRKLKGVKSLQELRFTSGSGSRQELEDLRALLPECKMIITP